MAGSAWCISTPIRYLLAAALFMPSGSLALPERPAGGAGGQDLEGALKVATASLQASWRGDPASAALPFPSIRLLPAGAAPAPVCNPGAAPRPPSRTGLYCSALGEVLLDRDLLGPAVKSNSSAVAYWVAVALAERLLSPASGGSVPSASDNLQANCLAGVLLGAGTTSSDVTAATAHSRSLLNAARSAYGGRFASAMGSASQRAYALLSGFGATASFCSPAEMEALAEGRVPDPELLQQIAQLPAPDRAFRNLLVVINSQCRPTKIQPCPRRLYRQPKRKGSRS